MKPAHLILIAMLLAPLAALHAADVANLRCEYRENPLGIDVAMPRLSWGVEDGGQRTADRGQKQTAYQILVASSEQLLKTDQGDLWDSGKVESDQSIQVEYKGKQLESRMQCYWKVRVWVGGVSGSGFTVHSSDWSEPTMWTMGLLKPEDFKAKWIGVKQPAPAPASRVPLDPGPLRIVSASYQPVAGAPARDVTDLLASRVQDSTLLIVAGNKELGGDPAPGIEKKGAISTSSSRASCS
jgi:hypothetical protein